MPLRPANYSSAERLQLNAFALAQISGPSVLLTRAGDVLCGRRADEELQHDREAAQRDADGAGGGGLFFVHSHRQSNADFELHARALRLAVHDSGDVMRGASVLIVNNNAASFLRHGNAAQPMRWLRAYGTLPGVRIRMLVMTAINAGYTCGEFHALAATVRLWRTFPWVLTTAGPDSLITPHGLEWVGKLLLQHLNDSDVLLLADSFPAPAKHTRFSMDCFAFFPRRCAAWRESSSEITPWAPSEARIVSDAAGREQERGSNQGMAPFSSVWAEAAVLCLRRVNMMPEMVLAEIFHAPRPSQVKPLPHGPVISNGRMLNRSNVALPLIWPPDVTHSWSYPRNIEKDRATQPTARPVWHTHNATAATRWLERRERALVQRKGKRKGGSRPVGALAPWAAALHRLRLPTWNSRQWQTCQMADGAFARR